MSFHFQCVVFCDVFVFVDHLPSSGRKKFQISNNPIQWSFLFSVGLGANGQLVLLLQACGREKGRRTLRGFGFGTAVTGAA
jgi:hypothetical protein